MTINFFPFIFKLNKHDFYEFWLWKYLERNKRFMKDVCLDDMLTRMRSIFQALVTKLFFKRSVATKNWCRHSWRQVNRCFLSFFFRSFQIPDITLIQIWRVVRLLDDVYVFFYAKKLPFVMDPQEVNLWNATPVFSKIH